MTITQEPAIAGEAAIGAGAGPAGLGPLELLDLLQGYTAEMEGLLPAADPGLTERKYELLELTDDLEIWAIHWPRDIALELHDHGGSSGALWVVDGSLNEHYVGADGALTHRDLVEGSGTGFGPSYIHDVVNTLDAPATSLHAYSPPMASMTFYRQEGATLRADRAEYRADPSWAP
jgi:Cysteine dioxygenase type I